MLSFLSSCKVSNPRTPLLARTTPSRYPPHTAYGLTVWLSVMFVSGILLDLLAVFNILLNCLPYVFHFLYHSLGVFLADSSILG